MFSASLSFCRLLTLFSVLLSPFLSFSFSLSRIFALYFQFVSLGFFSPLAILSSPLDLFFLLFQHSFSSFMQFPFFHLSSLLFHPSFPFFSLFSPFTPFPPFASLPFPLISYHPCFPFPIISLVLAFLYPSLHFLGC